MKEFGSVTGGSYGSLYYLGWNGMGQTTPDGQTTPSTYDLTSLAIPTSHTFTSLGSGIMGPSREV